MARIPIVNRVKWESVRFFQERNLSAYIALIRLIQSIFSRNQVKRLDSKARYLALNNTSLALTKILESAKRDAECLVTGTSASARLHPLVELDYSIIAKPYVSEQEKGIVLVSFESELGKLARWKALPRFLERYSVIFLPSWTGLISQELLLFSARASTLNFVMPVHKCESDLVNMVNANWIALPFNAASWVNEDFFWSQDERDIPCLMVANFGSFKRHFLLFKALKSLPPSITATCVGVPLGRRTLESIKLEAQDYGVQDRVCFVENPSQEELRMYFRRAKVLCGLSYREGAYIAVAESLLSGTPVVLFRNSHIGTKSLINEFNGKLVRNTRELAGAIQNFQLYDQHDQIRNDALERVSATGNVRQLNGELRRAFMSRGYQWREDLLPFFSMRLKFVYRDGVYNRVLDDIGFLRRIGMIVRGYEESL